MRESDQQKLANFMYDHRPDVVVLGANSLTCRTLKNQLEALVQTLCTSGKLEHKTDVLYADHAVAYRYAHTQRAAAEFPRYSASRLMAVSLARRYAQTCVLFCVCERLHATVSCFFPFS